jgi:REP element-mobilizing transposase RayT
MIPMHPQPLRDFDYKGFHYYSLTWCCDWRQTHFSQADRVELVRSNFLRASAETGIAIVVYTFMPDHVHKVVRGDAPEADAKRYMCLAKQYSGYYFK